MNEVVVES